MKSGSDQTMPKCNVWTCRSSRNATDRVIDRHPILANKGPTHCRPGQHWRRCFALHLHVVMCVRSGMQTMAVKQADKDRRTVCDRQARHCRRALERRTNAHESPQRSIDRYETRTAAEFALRGRESCILGERSETMATSVENNRGRVQAGQSCANKGMAALMCSWSKSAILYGVPTAMHGNESESDRLQERVGALLASFEFTVPDLRLAKACGV